MSQLRQPATSKPQHAETLRSEPGARAEPAGPARPGDARARLLQLQRAAGNRAVGQLLAQRERREQQGQRPRQGSAKRSTEPMPPIQRLVGFEVELYVPTYRAGAHPLNSGPGGAPDPRVQGFLSGGLPYDTTLGELYTPTLPPHTIKLKSDHNTLQTLGGNIFTALEAEPHHNGLPLVAPNTYVGVSNLEYDTAALDEMAPGSDAEFQAIATRIDNHVTQILANNPRTQASKIPDSNPATATGLPFQEIDNWVGLFPDVALTNALANFQAAVGWRMYPQATVGVLPTGLWSIYNAQHTTATAGPAPAPGTLQSAQVDALTAVVNGINTLYTEGWFRTDVLNWFQAPTAIGGNGGVHDATALRGILALALSYTIGDAMNVTNLLSSTPKNAVPFIVKLADFGAFKTQAATTWLQNNPPPLALVQAIGTWFHTNVPETATTFWTSGVYATTVIDPTRGPLYGVGLTPTVATQALLWRLLSGAAGVTPTVGSPHSLPAPDPAPAALNTVGGALGQFGIPLEYRWLSQRPTAAGQLWTQVFQTVLAEVRAANLAHVPEDSRDAIVNSW